MIAMETLLNAYPEHLRGFKRGILTEYLQCLILSYVFPLKKKMKMRLIGGTAVRIGWGSERFSEDMDFDGEGITKSSFESLGNAVARNLKLEGYSVEVDMSFRNAFRCFFRFPGLYRVYGLSPNPKEKLLIQLDYEPQDFCYEPQERIINRLGVFCAVPFPPAEVLLSMKIAALLGRRRSKGRDFYDVTYLSSFAKPDFAFLKKKIGIADMEALRKALVEKTRTMDMKAMAADVEPFLFSGRDTSRVLNFRAFAEQLR
jgi:hypothetical protein